MQVAMKRSVIRRKPVEPKSGADSDSESRDGGVQSVDRALSIIEVLAEDDEGYRLSDLAVRTGLSTSTVHRLLSTLESRRFVAFDRAESKWHVGARAFTVGATFARRRNFSAQAVPYLRKLRDLTRETANLAVVDDEFIIVPTPDATIATRPPTLVSDRMISRLSMRVSTMMNSSSTTARLAVSRVRSRSLRK